MALGFHGILCTSFPSVPKNKILNVLIQTELALCTERVEIVLSDPPPDIVVTELPVSEVASGLGSRFQSNKLTGGARSRFHSDK